MYAYARESGLPTTARAGREPDGQPMLAARTREECSATERFGQATSEGRLLSPRSRCWGVSGRFDVEGRVAGSAQGRVVPAFIGCRSRRPPEAWRRRV